MKTFPKSILMLLIACITLGCSHNYYNIPRESFEKRVKVLGVAPIFVDTESDIMHPEREALLRLIKEKNRQNEKELVALLKQTGTFFSVRLIDSDADTLFYKMMFRKERRDDASVVYNKYFYKLPELKEIVTKNGFDAVMFTVISGITRQDTVRSSNLMSYLKTDYNFLVMTSQIFDADGNILWEYPNFREKIPGLQPFLELQYPDFDEAKANESDSVDVKFKTIAGISRTLEMKTDSSQGGGVKVSAVYENLFSDMADLLKPEKRFLWWGKKEPSADGPLREQGSTAYEPAKPAAVNREPVTPAVASPEADAAKPETVMPEPIKEELIKEETL